MVFPNGEYTEFTGVPVLAEVTLEDGMAGAKGSIGEIEIEWHGSIYDRQGSD
jgi:hypothetical protein